MGEVPNSESFDANSSSSLVNNMYGKFKQQMDTVLQGGYEITIDLEPGKTDCPSNCRYNPAYKRHQGINGGICATCKGEGFVYDPRFTTYKCNRRWTNEPLDAAENTGEDTVPGRVGANFVRVKTVAASWNHIVRSIGATIDGQKVKLYREPRYVGWGGQNTYVISWWERASK